MPEIWTWSGCGLCTISKFRNVSYRSLLVGWNLMYDINFLSTYESIYDIYWWEISLGHVLKKHFDENIDFPHFPGSCIDAVISEWSESCPSPWIRFGSSSSGRPLVQVNQQFCAFMVCETVPFYPRPQRLLISAIFLLTRFPCPVPHFWGKLWMRGPHSLSSPLYRGICFFRCISRSALYKYHRWVFFICNVSIGRLATLQRSNFSSTFLCLVRFR